VSETPPIAVLPSEAPAPAFSAAEIDAAVTELLSTFSRAVQAAQLYDERNQLRRGITERLITQFENVLGMDNPLFLTLTPNRVLRNDEVVFDGSELDNSFAFRLHRDGIRQLAFARGLTREELLRLVELVGARPNVEEGFLDINDALWEAQFQHIVHVGADGFTEFLAGEGEEEEVDQDAALTRFQDVIGVLAGLDSEGQIVATTGAGAAGRTIHEVDFTEPSVQQLLGYLEHAAAVSVESAEQWAPELASRDDEDLLERVEPLVVTPVVAPPPYFPDDSTARIASRYVLNWLLRGYFVDASDIVTGFAALSKTAPHREPVVRDVLARSADFDVFEMVTAPEGPLGDDSKIHDALQFFRQHSHLSRDDIKRLAAEKFSEGGFQVYLALLGDRMAEDPKKWIPELPSMGGEIIAGALHQLVTVYDIDWTDAQLDVFWAALEHESVGARQAALAFYPGPVDDRFRQQLIEASRAPEVQTRLIALQRMVETGDATLAIFLIDRVRKVGMTDLPPGELELVLGGLVTLAGDRYLPFFRRQLQAFGAIKGGSVLDRDVTTFVKSYYEVGALLTALVEIENPEVIDLVREVRGNARGRLRTHCDELWRKVVSRWSDRIATQDHDLVDTTDSLPDSADSVADASDAPNVSELGGTVSRFTIGGDTEELPVARDEVTPGEATHAEFRGKAHITTEDLAESADDELVDATPVPTGELRLPAAMRNTEAGLLLQAWLRDDTECVDLLRGKGEDPARPAEDVPNAFAELRTGLTGLYEPVSEDKPPPRLPSRSDQAVRPFTTGDFAAAFSGPSESPAELGTGAYSAISRSADRVDAEPDLDTGDYAAIAGASHSFPSTPDLRPGTGAFRAADDTPDTPPPLTAAPPPAAGGFRREATSPGGGSGSGVFKRPVHRGKRRPASGRASITSSTHWDDEAPADVVDGGEDAAPNTLPDGDPGGDPT
jgi:hypothetical protein